jgi:hypothetical protein
MEESKLSLNFYRETEEKHENHITIAYLRAEN